MRHRLLSLGNWHVRVPKSSRLTSHRSFWKSPTPIVPRQMFSYQIQNAYALSYPEVCLILSWAARFYITSKSKRRLREIYRVLKPGGTIYFTEPNMLNPQIAIQKNIPWIKRKLGDSPDETAFFRWPLRRLLERTGYRDVRIDPFDFLHPKTPVALIDRLTRSGGFSRTCLASRSLRVRFISVRSNEQCIDGLAERQESKDRAVTLRNRARLGANKIFFFGIASFTGINSETFPIRRRSQYSR